MDFSREGTPYQRARNEGSSAGFGCFPAPDHGRDTGLNEQQSRSGGISEEARGHSISGHVQAGPEDHCLVGAALSHYHSQVHSGEEKCSHRSVKPSGSNSFLRMNSFPSVLDGFCRGYSHPHIDLFATRMNALYKVPHFFVIHPGSDGMKGHLSILVRAPKHLYLSPIPSSKMGICKSNTFSQSLHDSCSLALATKGVVGDLLAFLVGEPILLPMLWNLLLQLHVQKFHKGGLELLHLCSWKLICKANFSKELAEVVAPDLRRSTICHYSTLLFKFSNCYQFFSYVLP